MSSQIPTDWQYDPPEAFVAGDGPYASALASVLGTVPVRIYQLEAGPATTKSGGFSRVFDNLKWVLLVVPEAMPASEALQCHKQVWEWVEKLSSEGEQHELAFLFVIPSGVSQNYEESLAAGLVLASIDPEATGHAVWMRSGSLMELLDLIKRTHPSDAVSMRARRASDSRHIALSQLRNALSQTDPSLCRDAAKAVRAVFGGQEYHLDLFCRPPAHQNGNRLRKWLNDTVTGAVTPEQWAEQRLRIVDCLLPNITEAK